LPPECLMMVQFKLTYNSTFALSEKIIAVS
jgi:hypothetical protein